MAEAQPSPRGRRKNTLGYQAGMHEPQGKSSSTLRLMQINFLSLALPKLCKHLRPALYTPLFTPT